MTRTKNTKYKDTDRVPFHTLLSAYYACIDTLVEITDCDMQLKGELMAQSLLEQLDEQYPSWSMYKHN